MKTKSIVKESKVAYPIIKGTSENARITTLRLQYAYQRGGLAVLKEIIAAIKELQEHPVQSPLTTLLERISKLID